MVTTDDKIKAVKISLVAHNQGRLTSEELKAVAKVIDSTFDDEEDE